MFKQKGFTLGMTPPQPGFHAFFENSWKMVGGWGLGADPQPEFGVAHKIDFDYTLV